jgi:hypothetical protein
MPLLCFKRQILRSFPEGIVFTGKMKFYLAGIKNDCHGIIQIKIV